MRKTDAEIFEMIGLDRDGVIAVAAGMLPERPQVFARSAKQRPRCLICGQPINKINCRPFKQPALPAVTLSGVRAA